MIIFGTGSNTVPCGITHALFCAHCSRQNEFDLLLTYNYFHLYYVIRQVGDKHYLLLCRTCGHGWKCDPQKVEPELKRPPIPFTDRNGVLILILTIGGTFFLIGISNFIANWLKTN